MSRILRFLCIGAAVQDVFLSHSQVLAPVREDGIWFQQLELGGKFDVNKIDFSTGGGATNVATTFARQGHEAIFMGTIGRDPAGEAVMMAMDKEGIDTRHTSYSRDYNTGYSVVLLAPNGERTILTYRGASTHYDAKNFNLAGLNSAVDWLYAATLAGNFDILQKVFLQAKAAGVKVAYNPGKKELAHRNKLLNLLPMVDVLLVNREEAMQIVPGEKLPEIAKNLAKLVPTAVVTDGARGAVACDGQQIVKAGLYDNLRRPTDRTGAGDAFGSGIVVKIAEGKTLEQAVHFASANASEVCQAIGAKTRILRKGARIHDMDIKVNRIN
ncbi:sugar kinase [Alphaproteobacteria bacterium]|nr:sugar kinase [Alphaproteobacteria bacterium]